MSSRRIRKPLSITTKTTSAAAPLLRVAGISKRYLRAQVVNDVSFELARGQVLGLLGPNGSGKTTTLRMIAGTLRPSAGRIVIAGHDMHVHSRAARQNIGYVAEDAPIYGHLRVSEFLTTMAAVQGVARAAIAERVTRTLRLMDLTAVANRLNKYLSRGYRQRVAIACALLNDPPLVLLDEPNNGLDPRQIIECRHLIQALAENRGVIVSSHSLSEIVQVADRAAILLNGRLLSIESLHQGDGARLDLEARFLELTDAA